MTQSDQVITIQTLEFPAALFGLCNVYLAAHANRWNWLFGIATTSLYIIIFLNVKLYADTGLQGVFLLLQFHGYYQWLYGGTNRTTLVIERANLQTWVKAGLATITILSFLTYLLTRFTDSTTVYSDALITTLSLIAQWMFNNKWLENWLLWIVVDVISVGVYLEKSLYFTSVLYALLLIIAIFGYLHWKSFSTQRLSVQNSCKA